MKKIISIALFSAVLGFDAYAWVPAVQPSSSNRAESRAQKQKHENSVDWCQHPGDRFDWHTGACLNY